MGEKNEGWGCLFTLLIAVASLVIVLINPKVEYSGSSGGNNNSYWYKKRIEYENARKEQQAREREREQMIEYQKAAEMMRNMPVANTSINSSRLSSPTPDDAYDEGYNKYEWKNGRKYNYDIYGEDEYGNSVTGNITIDSEGNYGQGYVEDEDGNEKSIEVHWVNRGELEGEDEDGVSYSLEIE